MRDKYLIKELGLAMVFAFLSIPILLLAHELGHYLSALLYGIHGYLGFDWGTLTAYYQPESNVNWVVGFCGGLVSSLIFLPFVFNRNLFVKALSIIIVLIQMTYAVNEGLYLYLYSNGLYQITSDITLGLIGATIAVYLLRVKYSMAVTN
jgi:uncharacterized membrane protein YeaQ/YmgE (transglycosylase-associated protein family)